MAARAVARGRGVALAKAVGRVTLPSRGVVIAKEQTVGPYLRFATYRTPANPSKSASIVQTVASNCLAVA